MGLGMEGLIPLISVRPVTCFIKSSAISMGLGKRLLAEYVIRALADGYRVPLRDKIGLQPMKNPEGILSILKYK